MEIVKLFENNMIDYAGAVNQARAIPDARTGLKPIHRKILYAMYVDKMKSSGKFHKCAKTVGSIIARFSEHGDTATYDALVRLAQPWIQRYPLLSFHGNYGSQFGDTPAAYRYTESKLSTLAEEGMLYGLDKKNVEWMPNYTQEEEEPTTLPAIFPGLFCLPNQGLGYAVACHFVTYNLNDVATYIQAVMNDKDELPIIYPDFASGGVLVNPQIAKSVQETGKGSYIIEGKYTVKDNRIVFSEIPFNVAFDDLFDDIIELCKNGELVFITDLINNSGENGLELIVEVDDASKVNEYLEVLFNKTKLRNSYPVNQTALVNNKVKLMTFKEMASCYIEHNISCIIKEHEYDFGKANARIEILQGMLIAIANVEKIVEIIKTSSDAKASLKQAFPQLTDNQIKAILDMKLGRLSKLEKDKIDKELQEKKEFADYCKSVIDSSDKQKEILVKRLQELVKKYGDERRTSVEQKEIKKISAGKAKTKAEEIPQDVVVVYNDLGYIKAIPVAQYKKSKSGIKYEFKCTTKDIILCFSTLGKVYRITGKDIGLCGNSDKGKVISTILHMEPNEKILYVCSSEINEKHPYITVVTNNGLVKKSEKMEMLGATRNLNGVKYIGLTDNVVAFVCESNGDTLSLVTTDGYSLSFNLDDMRATGKSSKGVKGITLNDGATIKSIVLNNIPKGGVIQKRGGKGKKIC